MDRHGVGEGPLTGLSVLGGGTQNVLVRFRRGDLDLVLRRPPVRKGSNSDATMVREARVLGLLAGSGVPHAELVAVCDDPSVLGASFFLMRAVDGFNPTVDPPYPADHPAQHRLGLAMADALAAVARVDVRQVHDLGRPEGWLARQVPRWQRQLESYRELPGYPGADLEGVLEVAAWLDAHRPAHSVIGLIHGDFHFANVLARSDRPELAAVVDWELATLGDPMLDLAHLLATWPGTGPGAITDLPAAPGLPRHGEMIDRYARQTGRDLSDFGWFRVLACYRMAILLEGTNARAAAGRAPTEVGRSCHHMAKALVYQAQELAADKEN
jgi:aminoglycoside phosphotransferase (APT) family kinase protein